MKKIALLAALSAAIYSAPVFAEGSHSVEAYAGPIAGWDDVRVRADGGSASKSGVVYGGLVGLQMRVKNAGVTDEEGAVLGIEAELDGASTKASERDVIANGDKVQLKAGRDIYIGGRAGIMVEATTMIYLKGGYTNARATLSYAGTPNNLSYSKNLSGFRVGPGVEVGMGKVRLRAEYRFSSYGELKTDGASTGARVQRHQVVLGATYGF